MSVRRSGFTILELLVASSLMAIVVGSMVALTTATLAGWNRHTGKIGLRAQAEAVFDMLEADLAGLRFCSLEGESLVFFEVLDDRAVSDQRIALHFFSDSAGVMGEGGSLRKVLWTAQTDPENSPFIDDVFPSLFRRVLSPENTWEALQAGPVVARMQPISDGFLLPGCFLFRIEIWSCLADGSLVQVFPDPEPISTNEGDLFRYPATPSPGAAWSTPCYVEAFLGLLPERAGDVLRARRDSAALEDFDEETWIAENLALFSRRIPLQTGRF